MTSRVLTLATAVVVALSLSACDSSTVTVAPSAPAGVSTGAAPASGATLDAAAFAAALTAPRTVVLDVRTPAEFAAGHLPEAVNLDVQSLDFVAQVAELDPGVPYAVYCRSGNRSQVALDIMAREGLTHTYHLGGGIGAWQQAGGKIVTGG